MGAEVLVIGGGPAGLATGIAAAQAGYSVEIAEPQPGAIDKCCGEGLLPSAIHALARLGIPLNLLQEHGSPLRGISFRSPRTLAAAAFNDADTALGMRRTALHMLLHQRALACGVRITPTSAKLLRTDGVLTATVGRERRHPRWVVGADGAQSATRMTAGLNSGHVVSRRFGLRQHFTVADTHLVPAGVEVHWAHRMQAYVTPIGPATVGVAVLSSRPFPNMANAIAHFPALGALLAGAKAASTPRGAISLHRNLERVVSAPVDGARLALVGDASGSVDAVTGDGLALAFAQALSLGGALAEDRPDRYQQEHVRLMRSPRIMSRTLLAMGARPAVTEGCMFALSSVPGLFPWLLQAHTKSPLVRAAENKENAQWQAALTSARSSI